MEQGTGRRRVIVLDISIIILIFVIFALYALAVLLVLKSKKSEKYNLSIMMGIFIAWRTKRGRNFIEWLARAKRFWRWYGNVAIAIVFVCGLIMAFTLAWTSVLIGFIPHENKPSPQMLIGLPGINPVIPIWYGILALAVAIIFHEFAHGTLSRVAGIKLKSLGLLFCVVPIGAFAEPDEEELNKTSRRKRSRVFAVGPATNIIIALTCALIFSWSMMASLQPREDGVMVLSHSDQSELSKYGSELGMIITKVNGTAVNNVDSYNRLNAPPAATTTSVDIVYKGHDQTVNATSGVKIASIYADTPAEKAGLKKGMILYSINNNTIINNDNFSSVMGKTHAYERASVGAYSKTNGTYTLHYYAARLDDKYNWTGLSQDQNVGFLGVSGAYLGVYVDSPERISGLMAHPLAGSKSFGDYLNGAKFYISLPIIRLSPFPDAFTDVYQPTGMWASVPNSAFWVLANCFYWLFWLNLMVGLTNALPAIPFDGGYIFKDFVDKTYCKIRPGMDDKRREKWVNRIVYTVSIVFIAMIFWLFIVTFI